MKTTVLIGATLAVLGLAAASVNAQTQSTTTTTTSYVPASKLVGVKVKDSRGEEVGVVKDVVLDRNTGCMAYTVLSTGGTGGRVTGSAKTVAVPWSVYSVSQDPSVVTVRVERERIYNAPVFDYARIDEYSTGGWVNNVYSYYGVQPNIGVGVGVGSATTTTGGYNTQTTQTGVSGQTNAYASPGAPAAASPAVNASPAMSPVASASPSVAGKASPTSSAAASRHGRATPSASAAQSPGGTTESDMRSEKGKSRHHATSSPSGSGPEATGAEGATSGTPEETATSETKGSHHRKGKASSPASSEGGTKSSPSGGSSMAEPSATP